MILSTETFQGVNELLTQWNRVCLVMLLVVQLVRKVSACYGIWSFTIITQVYQLPYTESNQTSLPNVAVFR